MTRTAATALSLLALILGAAWAEAGLPATSSGEVATANGTSAVAALAAPATMVAIPAGEIELLYPIDGEATAQVAAFEIDVRPVTNAEFLAFIASDPFWARSTVPVVFVGSGYLTAWTGDYDLGDLLPDAPVTNVSWFAAAAYCEARGARLPTEAEWELVARAGAAGPDGRTEPGFSQMVLSATTNRAARPGPVGAGAPNHYGVHDMHGLVWEWVFEVGSSLNTADSRSQGDKRLVLVCAGGSVGATDTTDYAAFLRYAYRGGLTGDYSGSGLGFRCAS
ncbi:MAG: formylglycine-generating enzyme family protein [Trueperaceae bacterium]|nr:formylglycine-generating enzyme family protein [Trueperaceae bacterium]